VTALPDFEPYTVLRQLERGPSHELYLARHNSLQRQVWIKALRPEVPLSSSVARRLEREGNILARLEHPNVLGILDCVQRPPRLWLVLEAVEGWPLSEVLAALRRMGTPGSFEPPAAVALALAVAYGLRHAHEAGVVHGAIQPEHILISREGATKLSGFSLALLRGGPDADPIDTEPGASQSSYLSPEQLAGERPDERSDLFSLGVVLYELLTGQHPFRAADDRATEHDIRHSITPPLRQSTPEISPELERVVQRCLEKQPERRFESLEQLVRALEHVLGPASLAAPAAQVRLGLARAGLGLPSAAAGQRPRLEAIERREARRGLRRSLLGLGGASLLLVAGGALLSSWLESVYPAAPPAPALWTAENGAELLVVAEPWAHVFVDGVQLETTPFAAPLRLSSGEHFVRLQHPGAPPEQRRLSLQAGQRVVLEVLMQVTASSSDAGLDPFFREPDAGPPSP
jgi:hypothetical protein